MKDILQNASFALIILIISSQPVFCGELVSSGLCTHSNLNSDKNSDNQCKPGHLLRGQGITVSKNERICLLSNYRGASKGALLTHVWHFNGSRMPQEKPTLWREDKLSFVENIREELEWLMDKEEIGVIVGIAAIVKLILKPSRRYRTRSCKTLADEWVGPWKAQIYDEKSPAPLATYEFIVIK